MRNKPAAIACSLLLFSTAVHAQVIFSNFSENPADPHYAYADPIYGFRVDWTQDYDWTNGEIGSYGDGYAMWFTNQTGADQLLGTVSLGMYKMPDGAPPNLTIRLVKDAGGLPSANPADILEVLTVDPVIPEDAETFLHLASATHPMLEAGATYWVTAEVSRYDTATAADDVSYYWIQNNAGSMFSNTINQFNPYDQAWQGYYNQPDPPNRFPAPTLQVTAIPEPAATALALAIGAALLTGIAGRKRQGGKKSPGA